LRLIERKAEYARIHMWDYRIALRPSAAWRIYAGSSSSVNRILFTY
jgi:hypothetical protein